MVVVGVVVVEGGLSMVMCVTGGKGYRWSWLGGGGGVARGGLWSGPVCPVSAQQPVRFRTPADSPPETVCPSKTYSFKIIKLVFP